uniref:Transcription elongation factor SPT5 n=1 Tax=Oryzias sinensis TaxID=183150 RepID=A0A8C7YAQ8_9TELE
MRSTTLASTTSPPPPPRATEAPPTRRPPVTPKSPPLRSTLSTTPRPLAHPPCECILGARRYPPVPPERKISDGAGLCVRRYNTEQYSPYAAPSPQGSYQPSPSPQSYHQVVPSPVGYQNTHSPASYHPTPSPMAYQASPSPSPVGYSPMTPGAPSPGGYNPHTPGSNIEQGSSDWVTTDILVRVKDSFMDLMGQMGVIRSVSGAMCSVFMQESEKVVSISSDQLEPVTPTKNNKVKVILGEDREATGILLSIDGDDGIVRMELDDQLKILNLRFLGRLEH